MRVLRILHRFTVLVLLPALVVDPVLAEELFLQEALQSPIASATFTGEPLLGHASWDGRESPSVIHRYYRAEDSVIAEHPVLGKLHFMERWKVSLTLEQKRAYAEELARLQAEETMASSVDELKLRSEYLRAFLSRFSPDDEYILIAPNGEITGYAKALQPVLTNVIELDKFVTRHNDPTGRGYFIFGTLIYRWSQKGSKRLSFHSLVTAVGFYHRQLKGRVDYRTENLKKFVVDLDSYQRLTEKQLAAQELQLRHLFNLEDAVRQKLQRLPAGEYGLYNLSTRKLDVHRHENGTWTPSERELVNWLLFTVNGNLRNAHRGRPLITSPATPNIHFVVPAYIQARPLATRAASVWGSILLDVFAGGKELHRWLEEPIARSLFQIYPDLEKFIRAHDLKKIEELIVATIAPEQETRAYFTAEFVSTLLGLRNLRFLNEHLARVHIRQEVQKLVLSTVLEHQLAIFPDLAFPGLLSAAELQYLAGEMMFWTFEMREWMLRTYQRTELSAEALHLEWNKIEAGLIQKHSEYNLDVFRRARSHLGKPYLTILGSDSSSSAALLARAA